MDFAFRDPFKMWMIYFEEVGVKWILDFVICGKCLTNCMHGQRRRQVFITVVFFKYVENLMLVNALF